MSWLLTTLVATALWSVCTVATAGGLAAFRDPFAILVLVLYLPTVWLPLMVILTVAAATARSFAHTPIAQTAIYYALAMLLSALALGALYALAPNPGNRDASMRSLFQIFLIPAIAASLVYPLGLFRRQTEAHATTA